MHLGLISLDAHRLHLARAKGLQAHPLGRDVLVGLPVALHARELVVVSMLQVCVKCEGWGERGGYIVEQARSREGGGGPRGTVGGET